jgi:hypothetical protein
MYIHTFPVCGIIKTISLLPILLIFLKLNENDKDDDVDDMV